MNFMILVILLPFVSGVTLRTNGVTSTSEKPSSEDYNKNGNDYGYSYGVSDSNTGDHKTHWEKRENGVVSGSYSLLEPDGSTRLVEYKADGSGFHPTVKRLTQPVQNIAALQYPTTTSTPYYNRNPLNTNYFSNYNNRPIYSSIPNSPVYPNTGYNYNGRYYFPDTTYGPPVGNAQGGYTNGYLNSYSGYDSSYRGSELGPYNLGRGRQRGQGVPLLYSTYHGYDNLYH